MTNRSCEKPKKAAWFSQAPWHSPFHAFCITSCTILHVIWTSFNCHLVWVQYVLAAVCIFSGWVEAFPRHKANALTLAKKPLENMFPTWGIPSKCSP